MEIRLPDRWLERYVQRGGGGFDGSIPPAAVSAPALLAGAVQGANNGGHRDRSGAVLLNNPRAVERYAHGAILTATRFGKAVTQAYYGRSPKYCLLRRLFERRQGRIQRSGQVRQRVRRRHCWRPHAQPRRSGRAVDPGRSAVDAECGAAWPAACRCSEKVRCAGRSR